MEKENIYELRNILSNILSDVRNVRNAMENILKENYDDAIIDIQEYCYLVRNVNKGFTIYVGRYPLIIIEDDVKYSTKDKWLGAIQHIINSIIKRIDDIIDTEEDDC